MEINTKKMRNLFFQQSYEDSWEDYQRSLKKSNFPQWDYVILTASNETQAKTYQIEMDFRKNQGLLPKDTVYIAISDPAGARVGSGGATLNVLRYMSENQDADFLEKKILLIHSGGDSKRIPQYSVSGKLFAPVPRALSTGNTSTLFDEFIISLSGMPGRMENGMFVISGDVILLFNPLQIDLQLQISTVISFPVDIELGTSHGVFLGDENDQVARFLHKESEDVLRNTGAVNKDDQVNLDVGAIILNKNVLGSLFSLIATDNIVDKIKFDNFVNSEVCLNFYGDFIYPLANKVCLDEYLDQACETVISENLLHCRKEIWNALNPHNLRLLSLSPASFIHFGTTNELLAILIKQLEDYNYLGWEKQIQSNRIIEGNVAINNSFFDENISISESCYIENSYVLDGTVLEEGVVLSNIAISKSHIPSNSVLHGVKLTQGGYVVRMYHILDNPKDKNYFLQVPFDKIFEKYDINHNDIWEENDNDLWSANLYPICETMQQCISFCELLGNLVLGVASDEEVANWKSMKRLSLKQSFNEADVLFANQWSITLQHKILASKFILAMEKRLEYKKALAIFGVRGITEDIYAELMNLADNADFSTKIRVYYGIYQFMKKNDITLNDLSYGQMQDLCYKEIQNFVCNEHTPFLNDTNAIIKEKEIVSLPVRLNWGGGWTDTPPYCNENGGIVLNVAISLNGNLPVCAIAEKIPENCIIFESIDGKIKKIFTNYEDLIKCDNPFDPFALHKATLLSTGVIPANGTHSLENLCKKIGGGIHLTTKVDSIPHGSGLGTSSILAAACVKSIAQLFSIECDDNKIYNTVLVMEQLMTTGGGWQDQVGGFRSGIKFIQSKPSAEQELKIDTVILSDVAKTELKERFVLVYTGQRRLARNLLRDVVGNYIGNQTRSLELLDEMKPLSALMKFYLEQGDITTFAQLLTKQWEICQELDAGCTNTCINQIFLSCEDLLDGKFIAGAGGGGFLQMILKKGVSKEDLQNRLYQIFKDSGVKVWDFDFVW